MKQIAVPEDLFEEIEALRRSRRISRVQFLRRLVEREKSRLELKRLARSSPIRSEDQADTLAREGVAWSRAKLGGSNPGA